MSHQAENANTGISLFPENAHGIKEEFIEQEYIDDKVCVWKAINNIDDIEAKDSLWDDNIKQQEISNVDHIKIEPLSFEKYSNINTTDSVKTDEATYDTDHQNVEINNELLFCNHCQEVYQHYCTKCGMLVHILYRHTNNRGSEEIPTHILELKEIYGHLGIFALRAIPKDVTFGPFTGFSSSGCSCTLKGGRFVVSADKSQFMNWMQYVNPVKCISERNLFAFQCHDNLYYRSVREIRAGQELLVYYSKECEGSLNENVEMDFIPTTENAKNVFACTFCCFGFSTKAYLIEHKTICVNRQDGKFAIKELVQCPFCHIYLGDKEYSEYHLAYCIERNDRQCKTEEIQKVYVVTDRDDVGEVDEGRKCSTRTAHSKTHVRARHSKVQQCSKERAYRPRRHARTNHLKGHKYKCDSCKFKTNTKTQFESHVGTKHVNKFNYKCGACEYRTNYESNLKSHTNAKHLGKLDYKCKQCQYRANRRTSLEYHRKTVHLKEYDHRCDECGYETNDKSNFEKHIRTKHLKEFSFHCSSCPYKTNTKWCLEVHIKTIHLKEFNYKCESCVYRTNQKGDLNGHIKAVHLKEFNYKCDVCDYGTRHKAYLKNHVESKHI